MSSSFQLFVPRYESKKDRYVLKQQIKHNKPYMYILNMGLMNNKAHLTSSQPLVTQYVPYVSHGLVWDWYNGKKIQIPNSIHKKKLFKTKTEQQTTLAVWRGFNIDKDRPTGIFTLQ